ncbi:MAG: hypothetical protein U0359_16655 [Byssovorax sp.]
MGSRARRPGTAELLVLLAGASLLGLAACSSDLFHSTDWPTQCDLDAAAPGCPETTSTTSSSTTTTTTTVTTTTTTTGTGGGGGAGGASNDGGTSDGG